MNILYANNFYYMDFSYLLFMLPAIIIALWAQIKVKTTYAKYAQVFSTHGLTGESAARAILDANGLQSVEVRPVAGELTDNYDPRNDVINLSQSTYANTSVAAIGVAAHEAGHALQYAESYAPIKIRSALVPVCNFGATLSWPMLLIGYFMQFYPLVIAGIILFSLTVLFQLVTLPVEFNASSRAMEVLCGSGMLVGDEQVGARKVLSAAAMTYVAALLTSIMSLLRLLMVFGRRRN